MDIKAADSLCPGPQLVPCFFGLHPTTESETKNNVHRDMLLFCVQQWFSRQVAQNIPPTFFRSAQKTAVTVPPLYNIKNMQSNKHVLIHTSKFKTHL